MKKVLTILVAAMFALSACAGRTPNPVPQMQPQDNQMTCADIATEIQDNQTKIMSLIPKQNKTGKNVALGVTGAFFIVPLFFMDFSDAERVEVQSYQLRNNRLRALSETKQCNQALPAPIKFDASKKAK